MKTCDIAPQILTESNFNVIQMECPGNLVNKQNFSFWLQVPMQYLVCKMSNDFHFNLQQVNIFARHVEASVKDIPEFFVFSLYYHGGEVVVMEMHVRSLQPMTHWVTYECYIFG